MHAIEQRQTGSGNGSAPPVHRRHSVRRSIRRSARRGEALPLEGARDASDGWQCRSPEVASETDDLGPASAGGPDARGEVLAPQLSVGGSDNRIDSGGVMGSTVSCMQAASAGVEDDRALGVQHFALPVRDAKVYSSAFCGRLIFFVVR